MRTLWRVLHGHAAGEKEAVLIHRELVVGELETDEHEEGEEELVLLEERPADVVVERQAEAGVKELQALFEIVGLLAVLDRQDEESDEEGKRVLVHRIDVPHIRHDKEQDGRLESN